MKMGEIYTEPDGMGKKKSKKKTRTKIHNMMGYEVAEIIIL